MSIQVCRACLAHNTLMYTIANSTLVEFYEKITNVSFNTEDGRPFVVCYFCYHILKKCYRFTQCAIRTDEVLQQIFKSGIQITEQYISMIDTRPLFSYQRSPVTHFITPSELPQNVAIKREKIEDEIKQERTDVDASEVQDNNGKDATYIEIKIETELDIKEEDRWSPEDTVPLQNLHHSSDFDDDLDEPLERISIKEENREVEKESVLEMCVQEIRGAPGPKERKLVHTTKPPEKQEVQSTSKEDIVGEISTKNITLTKVVNHLKAKHSGIKHKQSYLNKKRNNFVCHYCDYKSLRKQDLVKHIRIHTGVKLFTCNYCEKKFTDTSHLTEHLRTHTGEKPFTCNYCDKKFTRSSHLSVHLRLHSGEKQFTCDYCDKKFTQNSTLTVHMRTHTGDRPFTCNYCDKKFTQTSSLSRHLRAHTGEKLFSCNYCEKKFADTSNLTVHLRTHTGEKPFTCNYCDKKFKSSNHLSVHLRIHTGEKPFTCNYCGKKFTQTSSLSGHLKKHVGENLLINYSLKAL